MKIVESYLQIPKEYMFYRYEYYDDESKIISIYRSKDGDKIALDHGDHLKDCVIFDHKQIVDIVDADDLPELLSEDSDGIVVEIKFHGYCHKNNVCYRVFSYTTVMPEIFEEKNAIDIPDYEGRAWVAIEYKPQK